MSSSQISQSSPRQQASPPFKHPLLDESRALAQSGQNQQAAALLLKLAEQVTPFQRSQILCNAANLLRHEDRNQAIACAEAAHQAAPDLAKPLALLAGLYEEARRRKDALDAAMRATRSKATGADLVDAGRHLARMGELHAALQAVKAGYQHSKQALSLASYALRVATQCADWHFASQLTQQLWEAHQRGDTVAANETPRTHVLWCQDQATNIKVASAFANKAYPARTPLVSGPRNTEVRRKIRVAYLSYDFREHATSWLAMGAIRHHDRDRFELYAYCTSFDDGSALRRDVLSRFDKVRSLAKLGDQAAAQAIAEDQIDVLVDLNGLTEGTRLGILAWRPAPVQISYLGYPGSAGGRFVDYIIADAHTVPKGQEVLFPEKIIRLPHTYQINDYLARYLPPRTRQRPAGLPVGAKVLGMFNNINKVNREVWQTWMQVLLQQPDVVLWLLAPNKQVQAALLAETKACGVDPARVVYAPRCRQEAHLARLQWCDLMLDPWPYGGHTTTSDALFAGVPVVAMDGQNFASRVSGGLLMAAGLAHLVQPDAESYVQCCVNLLRDDQTLNQLKRHLHQKRRSLPVFDAVSRTMHLEAAYMAAHHRVLKGLPPEHLWVKQSAAPQAPASSSTSSEQPS